MKKIAENIYEHNGYKVMAVPLDIRMPCCRCPFDMNACNVEFICSDIIGKNKEFIRVIENKGE